MNNLWNWRGQTVLPQSGWACSSASLGGRYAKAAFNDSSETFSPWGSLPLYQGNALRGVAWHEGTAWSRIHLSHPILTSKTDKNSGCCQRSQVNQTLYPSMQAHWGLVYSTFTGSTWVGAITALTKLLHVLLESLLFILRAITKISGLAKWRRVGDLSQVALSVGSFPASLSTLLSPDLGWNPTKVRSEIYKRSHLRLLQEETSLYESASALTMHLCNNEQFTGKIYDHL